MAPPKGPTAIAAMLLLSLAAANAFISSKYTQDLQTRQQPSMQTSPRSPPSLLVRSSALFSSTSTPKEDSAQQKELTAETIAEMIEVSFINSCLQLASGYVDVLKLFIVAVKAGYEANIPLDNLEKLVEECPVKTANRELMKEEKDLRREWMLVVYEMMDGLLKSQGQDIGQTNNDGACASLRVAQVVSSILDVRNQLELEEVQSGGKKDAMAALASLSVSDVLSRSETLTKLSNACTNPMEKAFLMNDVSVGILTCRVIEEERVCMEGSSTAVDPPRPPIPGTS